LSTYLFNPDDWVSQAEAARIRGVSRQAIARLVKKGRLQAYAVGGRTLVRRSEIEAFTPEPAGRPPNERISRSDQEAH
jgi:excisionase family DNA binding protein